MEQYVRIKNTDPDEPFIGKYDGEYITIPTESERILPWDVMVVWMGDPTVENTDRYQERREVYNRLCMMHHAATLTGNDPELLPPLEAYTDDGERIVTVLDDPEGISIAPAEQESGDIGKLQRQIDRLQARLEEQVAGLIDAPSDAPENDGPRSRPAGEIAAEIAAEDAVLNGEDAAVDPDDDELAIPEDTPAKIPVGKATPGKAPARKAPVKAPSGRARRTAGTAGSRAASRKK